MWGISILADFRLMGYKLSCCGSICSILGHCAFDLINLHEIISRIIFTLAAKGQ